MARKEEQTTALAVTNTNSSVATIARGGNIQQMKELGCELAKSGWFGEISSSGGLMVALTMADEGLSPTMFKRRYHVIKDTPSRVTNSVLGDFQVDGGTWDIHQADRDACDITFKYRDCTPYRCKITMEEMLKTKHPFGKDGKTLKDNWQNNPDDMLFARVCGKALRRVWPKGMGGVYLKEEVMDFDDPMPSAIPVEEVKKRVEKNATVAETVEPKEDVKKAEVADSVKEEVIEQPEVVMAEDAETCKIEGKYFGKKWKDIDSSTLTWALTKGREKYPQYITKAVIAHIENILTERGI